MLCLMLTLVLGVTALAQQDIPPAGDTSQLRTDTLSMPKKAKGQKSSLKSKVRYLAKDSLSFDIQGQKVYLYGKAELYYEDIVLKADYVEIDFKNNIVVAHGLPDSAGKMQGEPEFSEGSHTFRSKELRYNFDTKKGIIHTVITKEGDGYIHGEVIKKQDGDIMNIRTGKYTTCSLDHPHFEFRFNKSKVIPNDKIVTGPAFMTIADVPTPLFIPFGLFPNRKGQRSGVLLPTYGESVSRGFSFENMGYYFGISDYVDAEVRADLYTLGSWAVKTASRYTKRYRYNGFLNLSYAVNKLGIEGSPDYNKYSDFSIRWSHTQSEKAWPNSRFSSNVNIMSSGFNQFNPVNTNAYLSNTFSSSISYQTNWDGKYFLNAGLNHSQNTLQKTVTVTLPDLSFSVNRFFPLKRKNRTGPEAWYEKISVNYSAGAQNSLSTYDSLLFKPETLKDFRNGVLHSISVTSPVKVMKYFILSNSVGYKERWYSQRLSREFITDTVFSGQDTLLPHLETDTTSGFYGVRDVNFGSSLSTTLYGMVQFKKGPVKAVRHVITPSLSFSYAPGYGSSRYSYYDTYTDTAGKIYTYSGFDGSLYGTPPEKESGRIGLSISNNLEIKVRSKKDTLNGTRKIALIDNLTLSCSYDLAKDSLNLSPFALSGRTRLFKNIDISYSGTWDPYVLDSAGTKNLNRFEWDENRRLLRLENTTWNLSMNWNLTSGSKNKKSEKKEKPIKSIENQQSMDGFIPPRGTEEVVDFNIPWSLNLSYSLRYNVNVAYPYMVRTTENKVIQTFNFSGDLNITAAWKIGLRSGWDFETNKLTYTSVDIYRDLHCWEMRMSWIPIGFRQSWNFTINVKSSVLQDLKLNKKKDFRDY